MVNLKIKLPEGYLDEEVREGYTVTAEQKKIWAVLLDLLAELNRVCDKHGLTVLADSGTMLGAVRHKGFIPWDDDIDLSMSRSDYEKLCEVAPREFEHPYFFQTEETDPGSGRGHAQLKNSETTGILKKEQEVHYTFNQGIFIDIFPYDNVPDDVEKRAEMVYRIEELRNKSVSYAKLFYSKNPGVGFRWYVAHALQIAIKIFHAKYDNKYYREMEKVKLSCRNEDTLYIANLYRLWADDPDSCVWEKAWYKEVIEVPFEFITLKVPAGYDGSSDHGDIIFDTDRSYKEYL